jgi:hypothetical protein
MMIVILRLHKTGVKVAPAYEVRLPVVHNTLTWRAYCFSFCCMAFSVFPAANPRESLQQILKQPNVSIRQPYFQVTALYTDQIVNLPNQYYRVLTWQGFKKKIK